MMPLSIAQLKELADKWTAGTDTATIVTIREAFPALCEELERLEKELELVRSSKESITEDVLTLTKELERLRSAKTYNPSEVLELVRRCSEEPPLVPYDPSAPQEVMSEMYRDMENVVKGWSGARAAFLMNVEKELGLPQ